MLPSTRLVSPRLVYDNQMLGNWLAQTERLTDQLRNAAALPRRVPLHTL